jgi:hypothetical protein
MKPWLTFFSLILILAQLPFGQPPPEEPEKERAPVKGWWMVSHFTVPSTRYSKDRQGVIKAESLGTRSALFKKVEEKKKGFQILSWRWKISNVVRSAIETRKDRFDAAACVMVVFGEEKGSRVFEGGEPSGLKIAYLWASGLPKGRVFGHPGDKSCKVFVLESGDGKAGQWVHEERNVFKDYKTAFGKDPAEVIALGIQTDTDHSNEMVTAYYSEPVLRKK